MAHQLIEVVKLSTTYLGDHGSESPRLDAELLAAHALSIERLDLYLQFDRPLDDAELSAIRALIRRRGGGEPVAYIVGRREFYGRDFAVAPAVLIPRPDTETLVESVLEWVRGEALEAPSILDIGTGSGCIAVTLAAEIGGATAVAVDISADAIEVAATNAQGLGVSDRIDLRQGSWGAPLRPSEVFDIIVSNPPYVLDAEIAGLARDVRDFEPHLALTDAGDGLQSYREVIAVATKHRAAAGRVAVEVDPRRADAVAALMTQAWPGATVAVTRDLAGQQRVVTATGG